MPERRIDDRQWNAVYLLAAVSMIFMTLVVAVQPLFLRNVLGISFANAGAINANVQVVTEILDIVLVGYLGFLSDRHGRVPIMTVGFLVAAAGALLAPFSLQIGTAIGVGRLAFYYLTRVVMSLGTGAVWPQIGTLAGDFTGFGNRPRLLANTAFMMAFGATIVYSILMQIPQHAGVVTVMLMTAGIALIGAWLARTCLVDVAPRSKDSAIPWRQVRDLVAREPRLRLTFASAFFARADMVFVGLFLMLWFIYFADLVGIGQAEAAAHAGTLIGLAGFVVLVSIPLWGRFIERFGRVPAIAAGMALSGLGFAALGFIVNPFEWPVFVPTILVATGQAGCLVAPQVLTIDLTPKEIRGSVLGVFYLIGGCGVVFFVQIGGFLFDAVGPHAPFVFTGIGNLLIMTYALWVYRAEKREEAGSPHEETRPA